MNAIACPLGAGALVAASTAVVILAIAVATVAAVAWLVSMFLVVMDTMSVERSGRRRRFTADSA